jgi:predicted nucleotidyltransferase
MTTDVYDLQDDLVLAELVRRLREAYQPEQIYLFGSRARGESGPNSDYDLMIIVPDDAPPERHRSRLGYQALRGTRTAADVLVWTRRMFDERLHLRASLPATIVREGRLVYGNRPGAAGRHAELANQGGE